MWPCGDIYGWPRKDYLALYRTRSAASLPTRALPPARISTPREAGYRVGYDDGSHFSGEYKRLFDEPPMRDVQRLRRTAASRIRASGECEPLLSISNSVFSLASSSF